MDMTCARQNLPKTCPAIIARNPKNAYLCMFIGHRPHRRQTSTTQNTT